MAHGGAIGVIFDLDGTLVASERLYHDATERILSRVGRSLLELSPVERSRIPGRSALENWRFYRERFGLADPPEVLVQARMELVCEMLEERGVSLVPGAMDFVRSLSAVGMSLALATSSPRRYAERVLSRTGLTGRFDVVRTGDDCTRLKPDPEIFLSAAHGMGLPAARCVVVEDSHSGILAARAAGMRVLAVATDYTLPEQRAMADRVVSDLRGLGPRDIRDLVDGPGRC